MWLFLQAYFLQWNLKSRTFLLRIRDICECIQDYVYASRELRWQNITHNNVNGICEPIVYVNHITPSWRLRNPHFCRSSYLRKCADKNGHRWGGIHGSSNVCLNWLSRNLRGLQNKEEPTSKTVQNVHYRCITTVKWFKMHTRFYWKNALCYLFNENIYPNN